MLVLVPEGSFGSPSGHSTTAFLGQIHALPTFLHPKIQSDLESWCRHWVLTGAGKEQKRGRADTGKAEIQKRREAEEKKKKKGYREERSAEDEKCHREKDWIQARQQSHEERSRRGEEQKNQREDEGKKDVQARRRAEREMSQHR